MRQRLILCAIALAIPASLHAQSPAPFAFDLSIGRGFARTNADFKGNEGGSVLEGIAALRLARLWGGAVIGGANVGIQGGGSDTNECIMRPGGDCVPAFPEFRIASLLIGWEPASGGFRALTGPVYIDRGGRGWQGRFDVALPIAGRLALLFNTRAVFVTEYEDATFQLVSLGAGLRIR